MQIRKFTWSLALLPLLAQAGPVDLNTADAETIASELNGVGMSRAEAIVEYREQFGHFESADELLNVSGIGPQILERNRANISLSSGGVE